MAGEPGFFDEPLCHPNGGGAICLTDWRKWLIQAEATNGKVAKRMAVHPEIYRLMRSALDDEAADFTMCGLPVKASWLIPREFISYYAKHGDAVLISMLTGKVVK